MNLEELKKSNYIIYECVAGSICYGLNTPESDCDTRGIFILPQIERNTLLPIATEISNDSQDIKYYELDKFLKLAADNNPSIIELLWVPEDCITICTPEMKKIIDNRNAFISKKAYYTFAGYAFSMLKKAKSQNRFVNNPKSEKAPSKEDFCFYIPIMEHYKGIKFDYVNSMTNVHGRPLPIVETNLDLSNCKCARLEQTQHTYRLYYGGKGVFRGNDMLVTDSISFEEEENNFIGFLIYNQDLFEKELRDWHSYWDWIKNRNEKRWIDQEKGLFQYDRKNASHCVRLMLSCEHLLNYGEPIVRFEGKQKQYLMDIKAGLIDYDVLMKDIDEKMANLEVLKDKSSLPHSCNIKKVNELFQELVFQK